MLKFSKFILSVLIFVAFLYKAVYSANHIENANWKPHPKSELNLREFMSLYDTDGIDGSKLNGPRRFKRYISESNAIDATSNEIFPEEFFNVPLSQLDLDRLEKSPWMKYMIIRNEKKRNREFNPRLGRNIDDCIEIQRSRPPFAPRLGKKSDANFTPRLGRQLCSEYIEKQ